MERKKGNKGDGGREREGWKEYQMLKAEEMIRKDLQK